MKNKLFIVYIICVFGAFKFTPLDFYANLFLSLITVVGILNFLFRSLYNRNKMICWGTIICVGLIVMSIICSNNIYNQPFFSGLLAASSLIYCFGPFAFWGRIKAGIISFPEIWKVIRWIIWINALYIIIFSVFNFSYVYTSPFSGNTLLVDGGKISKAFIIIGIIFYTISAINRRKLGHFLYALLLFTVTQLHDIQRGTIVLVGIILLFIFFTYRKTSAIKKTILLLPFIVLTFTFLILQNTGLTSAVNEKFESVFKLIDGTESGNSIEDASVSVRIAETEYAMEKFAEHPIFGNGNLRASYQKEILPNLYFYPADIGLFGIMYLYGIIGLIIYLLILMVLKKHLKYLNIRNTVQVTLFFYLVYIVISTLKDGNIFLNPDLFFLLILLILSLEERDMVSLRQNHYYNIGSQ